MVHIEKEIKNDIIYLRLSHRARVDGKSKRIWSVWLGREDEVSEYAKNIKDFSELEFEPMIYDYGLPMVLMKMVERLDLINIINECTVKRKQGLSVGNYIIIATLQRCVKPQSKVHIKKWYESTYLKYIFPKITTYLDSMAYTNHFPYLTDEVIEAIETKIAEKLRIKFNVEMKELFFDPTNFFTYTNPTRENQTLFGHGHSKDGRNTLNLVNLSLICTRDGGIPVMYYAYPGGTNDPTHFKELYPKILIRLQKLKISAPTVILVFDKGNISPEAFKAFDDSGLHWICSVRPSTHKDLNSLISNNFPMYELPNKKTVGILETKRPMFSDAAIKKSTVPDYENPARRMIISFNPEHAKWNELNIKQKLQAKIDIINQFFKGPENRLAKTKRYSKWKSKAHVEEKIRKVIKSNNNENYLELISYNVNELGGEITYNIEIDKEKLEKYLKTLGKSYYMTSHPTMTGPEIIWLYRQQFNVERAFSYLKSPDYIRISPIRVHTDESVQGHTFTCVLGLLLLTLISREVREQFPELSVLTIKELLSEIKIVEFQYPGTQKIKKTINKLSPDAKKLFDFYKLNEILH